MNVVIVLFLFVMFVEFKCSVYVNVCVFVMLFFELKRAYAKIFSGRLATYVIVVVLFVLVMMILFKIVFYVFVMYDEFCRYVFEYVVGIVVTSYDSAANVDLIFVATFDDVCI